jgi:hypothetical protein
LAAADAVTTEETTRWRVGKIGAVLAKAGHSASEMETVAISHLGDPVRRPGYTVCSRAGEHDCVYVEWIGPYMQRGDRWRHETGRLAQTLRDAGYTVEGPLPRGSNWTDGMLRVTRPAAG